MDSFSFLSNVEPAHIEALYQQYKTDPTQVDASWRQFFMGFDFSQTHYSNAASEKMPAEFKVLNLIKAYRQRGHLFTKTNPVRTRRQYSPTLAIENFDLNPNDLNTPFQAGHEIGIGKASLKEVITHLESTYCQSIGVEYMYIRNTEIENWLKQQMEANQNTPQFSKEEKATILNKLTQAVFFEKFIHKKFPGQKRFSLEGAEAMIPALDAVIELGAQLGSQEFVIGMPHRGRLNVLTNILKKAPRQIFSEFSGIEYDDENLLGDVKYHLGQTQRIQTQTGQQILLTLSPNPSHLEAVNPVVEGIVRSRIDNFYGGDFSKIVPILIHGDASIAGQGIVYEVLQMSELPGYTTGGTIHLVVNNQLGFTTNYLDARSSTYCTDVAKTIQAPIFHVNGDDVEAVVHTIKLAMSYRAKFQKDVFIDLLCYRRYGHNEGDEPRFTQPTLYKLIEKHPDPRKIYVEKLIQENSITAKRAKLLEHQYSQSLETELEESKKIEKAHIPSFLDQTWKSIRKATDQDFEQSPNTAVPATRLIDIAHKIASISPNHPFFRKTIKLQKDRTNMLDQTNSVDWAMGELIAFGTLLSEGTPVRLSGQDVERGTFSQRHAALTIENTDQSWIPLNHLHPRQAKFEIYNSPLSEYGVLGFDYGYSLASPFTLTVWEAQFGDFNNGAQIIIDQYLSSAEDKWNVMNDLVMLLPHGYEGQGPEHSSARMERFLTLSAENNLQIVNCTTPANYFHVLRRQLYRPFRKPLVIFTPKSLLRHPSCVSPMADFTRGGFKEVIDDREARPKQIEKIIFCSGKVYYDLYEKRKANGHNDVAIVRIEQLNPLPRKQILKIIGKYTNAKRLLWVQEEPINMGAWPFIQLHLNDLNLKVIARPASGSPATGSSRFHAIRQKKIVEKAFEECDCHRVKKECRMVCIGNRWRTEEQTIQKERAEKTSSQGFLTD